MKALILLGLLGCSQPRHVLKDTSHDDALAHLSWMAGTYETAGKSESWVQNIGAIYGVALHDNGDFDVMIVDDADGPGKPDGIVRYIAIANGNPGVEFRETTPGVFVHGDSTVKYSREANVLTPSTRAAELEAADRAFSDDTGKRGIEGWVAAFATKGAMLRKNARVEGSAAIGEMMKDVLAEGILAWEPIASGVRGDIGFTVGKAAFVKTGATKPDWRSTYVTIWTRESNTWKVLFDVGRAVNE